MENEKDKQDIEITTPTDLDNKTQNEVEDEENLIELMEAMISEFDAIHARLDNNDAKFSALIGAVSSLTDVLKNRTEISSATEDDVNDMFTLIKGQREIINAIITIPELGDNVRRIIAKHLMSLSSWETIEAAQERLQNRESQKSNVFNAVSEGSVPTKKSAPKITNPVINKPTKPSQENVLKPTFNQQPEQKPQQQTPPVQVKARSDAMPAPQRNSKAKTSWGTSPNQRQQQKPQSQAQTSNSKSSMPPPIKVTSLNSK